MPITDGQYQAIPTGLTYFPDGLIVQDGPGGQISIMQGGLKCLLSSEVQLYLGNPSVTVITDARYQAIPSGLQYFPDGMIVQDGPGGQISIVQGGVKRLVGDGDPNPTNNPVYQFMGDPPITAITDAEYQGVPTGLAYFHDGMIVQDALSGQISIIQNGVKHLVDSQVLKYLGASPGGFPVTSICDAEYQAIPTGLEYFPMA